MGGEGRGEGRGKLREGGMVDGRKIWEDIEYNGVCKR